MTQPLFNVALQVFCLLARHVWQAIEATPFPIAVIARMQACTNGSSSCRIASVRQPSRPCGALCSMPCAPASWTLAPAGTHVPHSSWACPQPAGRARCVHAALQQHSRQVPWASRGVCRAAAGVHPAVVNGQEVAIVIVDHGSRKKASNDMLVHFGLMYQQLTGAHTVEIAHMEIAEPTIEHAIDKCVAAGAKTIVVAPYFLSKGRHIQEDIPALVNAAQAKHPGVKCIIADPVGVDPLMAQVIHNRVQAALQAVQVPA